MINTSLLLQELPILIRACSTTLYIAFFSTMLGLLGGTLIALAERSSYTLLRVLAQTYIFVVRGTPMIVQIVFYYYVFNLPVEPITVAIIAIGCNSSAYISQVIKTGIKAVGKGQIEAATVMGFTPMQITRYFILPQAFRAILPALGNEFTTLIKDSSLAYIIGVNELFKTSRNLMNVTYDVVTIYVAIALLYFIMTTTLTVLLTLLEKKWNMHAEH